MKATNGICVLIAALIIFCFPSKAKAFCQATPPRIIIDLVDQGYVLDHTRDLATINAMGRSSIVHQHGSHPGNSVTRGITLAESFYEVSVLTTTADNRSGSICAFPSEIRVRMGHQRPQFVAIQREYPVGSCQYNTILAHELIHVEINKRGAQKYAGIMEQAMRQVTGTPGFWPRLFRSQNEASQEITSYINSIAKHVHDQFQAEIHAHHGALDSPESYRQFQAACPSW